MHYCLSLIFGTFRSSIILVFGTVIPVHIGFIILSIFSIDASWYHSVVSNMRIIIFLVVPLFSGTVEGVL